MLVLDADDRSGSFLGQGDLIEEFLAATRWVTVLDVSAKDHEALGRHTGFDVTDDGNDSSELFMFGLARSPEESGLGMVMVDSGRLMPLGGSEVGKEERRSLQLEEADTMARLVRGEITADRGGSPPLPGTEEEPSVRAPGDSCRTDTGDPGLCLDSAQHDFKKYVTQDSQTSLRDGYWKNSDNLCCSLHSIPKAGSQVPTWTAVHFFDVYLENAQKPFGDNQVVLHRFQGTFNPVGQGNWWQMHRDFGYWLNALNYYLERAWWTGLFEVSVNPVGATQRYLRPDPRAGQPESQPPTPTSETQYTTGSEFTIGITAAKPDAGAGISASYTTSNSKTTTIPAWTWQNQSGGNRFQWQFHATSPCDPRPGMSRSGCFLRADVAEPNLQSRTALQIATQGRWLACQPDPRSCRAPLAGDSANLSFELETPATLIDDFCAPAYPSSRAPITCDANDSRFRTQRSGPAKSTYGLDVSTVNPCPSAYYGQVAAGASARCTPVEDIQLFRCKPAPQKEPCTLDLQRPVTENQAANGAAKERIGGRVILATPARKENGVEVILYSNLPNAQLKTGSEISDVRTRDTIRIAKGCGTLNSTSCPKGSENSNEFTLITNKNGLTCPTERTVTVTLRAFLVSTTSDQLDVERPSSDCQ